MASSANVPAGGGLPERLTTDNDAPPSTRPERLWRPPPSSTMTHAERLAKDPEVVALLTRHLMALAHQFDALRESHLEDADRARRRNSFTAPVHQARAETMFDAARRAREAAAAAQKG